MAGTQYLDLGAIQKKDGGSGTKGAQYLDLGALQKQAAAAASGAATLPSLLLRNQLRHALVR